MKLAYDSLLKSNFTTKPSITEGKSDGFKDAHVLDCAYI